MKGQSVLHFSFPHFGHYLSLASEMTHTTALQLWKDLVGFCTLFLLLCG